MQYRVYIDANANHTDTSQRTLLGVYERAPDAVAAAREAIRARLVEEHRPGMKSEDLLQRFARRGESAFILPEDEHTGFDAADWTRECAQRLCWRESLREQRRQS